MQINNIAKEILSECRKLASKKFDKKKIEEIENKDNFINALINGENFNIFYSMLEDEVSKKFFRKAIRYRYMLPFYPKALHPKFTNINKDMYLIVRHGTVNNIFLWAIKLIIFALFKKSKFPSEIDGIHIRFNAFGLKQYELKNVFEVKNDAVVFDIGAWKGDTAYFFSKKCDDNAKIYAFEPDIKAYEVLEKVKDKYNLNNVIVSDALFSNEEKEIDFVSMEQNIPSVKMKSTTIDKFVEENNIERIDFIKMDVEGAERSVLEGAVNTIKKFRPCLAIAIYHGGELFMEDFYELPIFIKSITENYKYYIRTFSPYVEETILFCKPKD